MRVHVREEETDRWVWVAGGREKHTRRDTTSKTLMCTYARANGPARLQSGAAVQGFEITLEKRTDEDK